MTIKTKPQTHTPGPWEVRRMPSCHTAIYPHGAYDRVADVFSSPDYECEENKANARLIAAAPELLSALKELVYRCDGQEGIRADGSNIQTMQAHAVIAKAENLEVR